MNKIIILFLVMIGTAHAGMFVEPIVGYSMNNMSHTYNGSEQNVDLLKGMTFGARLGGGIGPLYICLDGMGMSSRAVSLENPAVDTETSNMKFGFTFIFNPPVLPFRAWAGYNIVDRLGQTIGFESNKSRGTSYKLGASLNYIPFISLNVEYLIAEYPDYSVGSYSFGGVKSSSTIFSISVPIELPF